MPARSNPFQKLVTLIEDHMWPGATVTESHTDYGREIDILIESDQGGITFRVAVECRDEKRPQGQQWLEELAGKYSQFPVHIHKVFAVTRFLRCRGQASTKPLREGQRS